MMSDNKTIQIISFNETALSWPDWEVKFLAWAQSKEFTGILKGTAQAPPALQGIDEKTPAGKIEKQLQ